MHTRGRALFVVVALVAGVACGGRVSGDPAADSGASDGSPSQSSRGSSSQSSQGGQTFGVCPPDAPTLGDPCVTPNQGCIYVYGGGGCVSYVCDGSSHWVSSNEGC